MRAITESPLPYTINKTDEANYKKPPASVYIFYIIYLYRDYPFAPKYNR